MNVVVNIQKIGHRGLGIARSAGKVVLVPFAAPGDQAEVRITRSHRHFDEAEIVRLINPSLLRQEPPCDFFGRCGGCQLQHIPISFQRSLKEEIFREMLSHSGKVGGKTIKEMACTTHELEYRSHIEVHVDWREKPFVGFMARGKNEVVSVNRCLLAFPHIQFVISEVSRILEGARAASITRVAISSDFPGEHISLTFFSSRGLPAHINRTLVTFAKEMPKVRGLYGITRAGGRPVSLREDKGWPGGVFYSLPMSDEAEELTLEVWPGVFRQVNPNANQLLVSIIVDWVRNLCPKKILELYSGMGNFTIPLSFFTQELHAIEGNALAVENAQVNALRHCRKNIRWVIGSVEEALKPIKDDHVDLLIMDPPRGGAKEILKKIIRLAPKYIIYISCEPATLARDIRFLQINSSYEVEMTQPIDMFPQTFHIESVTVLKKA